MISFSLEYKLIHDFGIYHMIFRYARHNGGPEIIFAIALWVKSKMATITARLSYLNYHHFRQKGPKSIILMSTIGFSGIPDIMCGWKVRHL